MNHSNSRNMRKKVAREAAHLLYFGFEKEYKQAKLKAGQALGVHILPANLEVAIELDRIAQENEGNARKNRLVQMRKQALNLMKILTAYNPVLVGSVWRGTIHRGSDIDIISYHDEPDRILQMLRKNDLSILETERITVTKKGKRRSSLHIHIKLEMGEKAEVIIRDPKEACCQDRCEIHGDPITGLQIQTLERILKEEPARRHVPF